MKNGVGETEAKYNSSWVIREINYTGRQDFGTIKQIFILKMKTPLNVEKFSRPPA